MRSKSSTAKYRRKGAIHKNIKKIQIRIIDRRGGINYYLISLPIRPTICFHMEASGEKEMMAVYHRLISLLNFMRATLEKKFDDKTIYAIINFMYERVKLKEPVRTLAQFDKEFAYVKF